MNMGPYSASVGHHPNGKPQKEVWDVEQNGAIDMRRQAGGDPLSHVYGTDQDAIALSNALQVPVCIFKLRSATNASHGNRELYMQKDEFVMGVFHEPTDKHGASVAPLGPCIFLLHTDEQERSALLTDRAAVNGVHFDLLQPKGSPPRQKHIINTLPVLPAHNVASQPGDVVTSPGNPLQVRPLPLLVPCDEEDEEGIGGSDVEVVEGVHCCEWDAGDMVIAEEGHDYGPCCDEYEEDMGGGSDVEVMEVVEGVECCEWDVGDMVITEEDEDGGPCCDEDEEDRSDEEYGMEGVVCAPPPRTPSPDTQAGNQTTNGTQHERQCGSQCESSPSTANSVESASMTAAPSPNHTPKQKSFMCPAEGCENRAHKLKNHVRLKHGNLPAETVYNALHISTLEGVTMKCPVEDCVVPLVMSRMRPHFNTLHPTWLKENGRFKERSFKDMKALLSWKDKVETQWGISHTGNLKPGFTSFAFVCNRHQTTTNSKPAPTSCRTANRRTRAKPSCKTEKCPGRIYVKRLTDGSYLAEFYNIHTHPVGTGNMKHVPLSQEMKNHIASELVAGVSQDKIYKDVALGGFAEQVSCVLVILEDCLEWSQRTFVSVYRTRTDLAIMCLSSIS